MSFQEGQKLANKIEAAGYVECSALTMQNISHVFHEAMKAVVMARSGKGKKQKKHKNAAAGSKPGCKCVLF